MNSRWRFVGARVGWVVAAGLLTACSTDSTGLDSSQLASQWTSTSTSMSTLLDHPLSESLGSNDVSPDVVKQAFEDLVERRVQCGRDPGACDVSELAVTGSTFERQLSALMAKRASEGISASDRGRATYRIEAIDIESSERARVTTCLQDDTVLVVESAVYDDSVYSARSVWTLEEVGGRWLWSDEKVLEWIMEGDLCTEP